MYLSNLELLLLSLRAVNVAPLDFEGGGCATLTDLYNARAGKDPLYVLDENDKVIEGATEGTGRWLLKGELFVYDGVTLYMHGTSIGGDCDVLRIQSDGDDAYHEFRAHGANLSFKNTKVGLYLI